MNKTAAKITAMLSMLAMEWGIILAHTSSI